MTPERWKRVDELFNAALDLAAEQRAAYLQDVCGDDTELRQQVEHYLERFEQAGDFIEAPAAATASLLGEEAATREFDAMLGRRIGSYKLIRELGRGGMGAVYLAVRVDEQFRQRAAIKLLKRGMDTDFILRRFRNERQILAALDHPNIARLLDGGTTDDGLPYFVMEYIEGLPLQRYCDTHRLNIAERLKLFQQVCAAVAYAHDHHVIHRDIKPGNILVADDGTTRLPKLLDFGIAKILDPDLVADTLDLTMTGMRLMTPEYASPEQARGEHVTNATDQYSLGVLLYELLTGQRPHQLRQHLLRAPHEIARIISEEVPTKPSELITRTREVTGGDGRRTVTLTPETVSRDRSSSPAELREALASGLDDIVMQALDKDPARRYGSVQEFAQDIARYLEGQPLAAPVYEAAPATAVQMAARRRGWWKWLIAAGVVLLFLTAAYRYLKGGMFVMIKTAGNTPSRTLHRLTHSMSNDVSPKVSPDGKQIAFISDGGGKVELFIMNLDGSGFRSLTNNTLLETGPDWSPDGRRLVFGVETAQLYESDLYVMELESGKLTRLTNTPGYDSSPTFSPNGKQIAFSSNRGHSNPYDFDIWLMNADGSQPHRLTDYEEYDADAKWSPDGQRIVFTRAMPNKNFDIVVMNADGSNLVNLTNTPEWDEGGASWSPDGKWIAYGSNRDGRSIWVMKANGANPRQIVPAVGTNTNPVWTPDSRQLVFVSTRDFNPEIYLLDLSGL